MKGDFQFSICSIVVGRPETGRPTTDTGVVSLGYIWSMDNKLFQAYEAPNLAF